MALKLDEGQGQDAHLSHGGCNSTKGHNPNGLGGVVGTSNRVLVVESFAMFELFAIPNMYTFSVIR